MQAVLNDRTFYVFNDIHQNCLFSKPSISVKGVPGTPTPPTITVSHSWMFFRMPSTVMTLPINLLYPSKIAGFFFPWG